MLKSSKALSRRSSPQALPGVFLHSIYKCSLRERTQRSETQKQKQKQNKTKKLPRFLQSRKLDRDWWLFHDENWPWSAWVRTVFWGLFLDPKEGTPAYAVTQVSSSSCTCYWEAGVSVHFLPHYSALFHGVTISWLPNWGTIWITRPEINKGQTCLEFGFISPPLNFSRGQH